MIRTPYTRRVVSLLLWTFVIGGLHAQSRPWNPAVWQEMEAADVRELVEERADVVECDRDGLTPDLHQRELHRIWRRW